MRTTPKTVKKNNDKKRGSKNLNQKYAKIDAKTAKRSAGAEFRETAPKTPKKNGNKQSICK